MVKSIPNLMEAVEMGKSVSYGKACLLYTSMKKFADTVRRLLSIALNLFIVWAEPIALPMSWDWGKEQMRCV